MVACDFSKIEKARVMICFFEKNDLLIDVLIAHYNFMHQHNARKALQSSDLPSEKWSHILWNYWNGN